MIAHFTNINSAFLHILETGYFRLSKFVNMNDPHEYRRQIYSVYDLHDQSLEIRKKNSSMLRPCRNVQNKKIFVGSFVLSKKPNNGKFDIDIANNAPMWAHYGKKNTGAILFFDELKMVESLKLSGIPEWGVLAHRIKYINQDKHTGFSWGSLALQLNETMQTDKIAHALFKSLHNVWFSKHFKWSYEDEYRIVVYCKSKQDRYINIRDCLTSVVVGDNCGILPDKLHNHWQPKLKVPIFRAQYDTFKFRYFVNSLEDGTS